MTTQPIKEGSNIDPNFPLCDLHRHLDGSVRLETILELADQHGVDMPALTPEGLKPFAQVVDAEAGLMEFIGKFRYLTDVLVDTDACRRIAKENVEDAHREGIDYIELRFSPWFMSQTYSLQPDAVVEAVIEGTREGEVVTGIKARLIGILSRTYGEEACMSELDALLAHREGLVGLDLAGDEKQFPAERFRRHFDRGRDAGLRLTVHAGEADGAHSVWAAVNELGAERIGHGIRAIEDERLLDHLAKQGIGLEVCITSNVHTSAVTGYASHPARKILQHGVKMNLNTDDPGISGIDLPFEYNIAAGRAGLDQRMVRQTQRNALEMAFLDSAQKQELVEEKTRYIS